MDFNKIILGRRSIRKFSSKDVSHDKINSLLDLARYAPSSGNVQNWQFIVVKDKTKKNDIARACLEQYWMNATPVLIVICNDKSKVEKYYPKRGSLYGVQNCSLAAMIIMLKAVEYGLSSCWVGAFNPKAISRILRIPDNFEPQIILPIGYADEKPGKKMLIPLERVASYEKYNARKRPFGAFPLVDKAKKLLKKK